MINPPITSINRFCFWPHLNLNSEANDSLGVMTIKIWSTLEPEVTKYRNIVIFIQDIPSHHPEMRCHLQFTRLVSSGIAHQRDGWWMAAPAPAPAAA